MTAALHYWPLADMDELELSRRVSAGEFDDDLAELHRLERGHANRLTVLSTVESRLYGIDIRHHLKYAREDELVAEIKAGKHDAYLGLLQELEVKRGARDLVWWACQKRIRTVPASPAEG